jgi:hypothetical protein
VSTAAAVTAGLGGAAFGCLDDRRAGTDLGSALALFGLAVRGDITASVADLRTLFATDLRY